MVHMLSVVIPTYNSEKSIQYSIESVLNQTFKDIVLIIVDDASDDRTNTIIKSYSNRDNVKIVKNEFNIGPAGSRSVGLKATNSKYIAFLDSDDWLDNNCYERAINLMEENDKVSICFWSVEDVYSRFSTQSRYNYSEERIVSSEYALDMYSHKHFQRNYLSPLPGNKVMRKSIVEEYKITFDGWYYDDDIFTFDYLFHSELVGIIPDCKLYYFQNEGSVMHSIGPEMIQDFFQSFSKYREKLISCGDWSYMQQFFYPYCEKCILNLLKWIKTSKYTEQEKANYYMNVINGISTKLNIQEYSDCCDIGELFNV